MPSSSNQGADLDTFCYSAPETVSPHLSHDIYGELDPPWLIQVFEFPWRHDGSFEAFDLLIWLVDKLDPKSRGALRRVHSRIKRIFPDASFFDTLRITPRKTDPFKHLSKTDLRTIGDHCRELRILFDAVSSKETVHSVVNTLRRPQEGHDDGEDWERILLCLRNTTKITLRTTAKRPGHVISSANINMLTEPFRQNFQYADFLQNLTTLRLVPMHVPYITNFCSLGTDCTTEAWTVGKIWSQIVELECQFYVQQEGGMYEIEWVKILQTLHRWLRGFKKNVRTLKFHWVVAKFASGPRPHPLALEKWLPETDVCVESPIFWNALTTLGIGNVELHEDDADSELNLLDSRVPNIESYYRLKYATNWEVVDFAFEAHETKDWESYEKLANGRWKDPPGAERPRQERSLKQTSLCQSKSLTRPSSGRGSTHLISNISRAGVDLAQDDLVGPFFLPQAANPTPVAPKESPRQSRSHHTSLEKSSTHHPGNTSGAGFNFSQEFSPRSPTSQHSLALGRPTQNEAFLQTLPNSTSAQHQAFESKSPNLRASKILPELRLAIEDAMDMYRPQERLKQFSGGYGEGSGKFSPRSPQDKQFNMSRGGQRFKFEDDDEDEETHPQQQLNPVNQGWREYSGSSTPLSPLSRWLVAPDRQENSSRSRIMPPQPRHDDSFDRPSYGSVTNQTHASPGSGRYLPYEETHEAEGHGHLSRERVSNSRNQPALKGVATFDSRLHVEPGNFDSGSTRKFASRNTPMGASSARNSVSSKYSMTQPTAFSRTQTRPEPIRRPTPGNNDDSWSQKETPHLAYEQGSYVTSIEDLAITDYAEFMGNPFADDDQSDAATLVSAGPSDVHRGHIAALETDFRPLNSVIEERYDPGRRNDQLEHNFSDGNSYFTSPITRIRNSTPPEATRPLVNIEDLALRRRSEFDAPEVVPARVCPLLPEEHVAMFQRKGRLPGLALVQAQNSGLLTGDDHPERMRRQFDREHSPTMLKDRHSAPDPEQPSRPRGKGNKAKRRNQSEPPVENVRGEDVSALSAKEAERRSRDNILTGAYFPTEMSSPTEPKKGFMRKMFKRRDSEDSIESKASKRESKTSDGIEDGGKRRSFGKKVKEGMMDSVKTVKDGGKATFTIGRAVMGL